MTVMIIARIIIYELHQMGLRKKIDKGEDIFVFDVRNQHEHDDRDMLLQS